MSAESEYDALRILIPSKKKPARKTNIWLLTTACIVGILCFVCFIHPIIIIIASNVDADMPLARFYDGTWHLVPSVNKTLQMYITQIWQPVYKLWNKGKTRLLNGYAFPSPRIHTRHDGPNTSLALRVRKILRQVGADMLTHMRAEGGSQRIFYEHQTNRNMSQGCIVIYHTSSIR